MSPQLVSLSQYSCSRSVSRFATIALGPSRSGRAFDRPRADQPRKTVMTVCAAPPR